MKHYTFLWMVGNFSKFSTWFFGPLEGVPKLLGSNKFWGNNISFHIQFKIDKFSGLERVIQFFVTFRTNFHNWKCWRLYNCTTFYVRLHRNMNGCVIPLYFSTDGAKILYDYSLGGKDKSRDETWTLQHCSIPCSTAESLNTLQPISQPILNGLSWNYHDSQDRKGQV